MKRILKSDYSAAWDFSIFWLRYLEKDQIIDIDIEVKARMDSTTTEHVPDSKFWVYHVTGQTPNQVSKSLSNLEQKFYHV